MTSEGKIASAVGGKTARACDSCLVKRARWYCAADDAFLCQGCDGSVHSANSLARRHERVRLKTASLKPTIESSIPSWHQGFTRKARTTRHGNKSTMKPPKTEEPMPLNPLPLVPEMGSDEASPNENEDQLLYRVPIFDPLVAELCTTASNEAIETNTTTSATTAALEGESKSFLPIDVENLPGFLPSDMDLEEFAADVESLLGRGLDEDTFGMEELGLLNTKQEETTMETMECEFGNGRVKVEEEEVDDPDADGFEMGRETLDLNFDCDSPTTAEDVEEEKVGAGGVAHGAVSAMMMKINDGYNLKLDYEAVIAAWASQGSPWTTGDKFHFNPDDWWPDCSTTCSMGVHHHHLPYGDMGGGAGGGGQGVMGDGGREARVSRYREKRRTRLFSKKIRYEVRKLNAEKRPRMKGRFVKRASFAGSGYPF